MIQFERARLMILDNVAPTGTEQVALLDAVGRVLAVDLSAPWDMPLWDNSAMDGYAVRSEDCLEIPCKLKVTGYIPAGATGDGCVVEPACAVRIMTGAPIPSGCDAVVPVEETDDGERMVTLRQPVKRGQHIRMRGEDVVSGAGFINAGMIVRPPEVSILANFGKSMVTVYRRPVVAIVSTGDELVEPGTMPGAGQIINSNALAIAAAVAETGCIPRIAGIARDNPESHRDKLREGLKADVLITTAGVSAGDLDLVRDILQELGAEQLFWKVGVKPGGPTAFAKSGETPVFSLPGNPVSAIITFEEFVRPALLKMLGHRRVLRPMFKAVLRGDVRKKAGKVQILRVKLEMENGRWYACSAGNQQTAILKTMVDASALAIIPADRGNILAGEELDVHFYGNGSDLTEVER